MKANSTKALAPKIIKSRIEVMTSKNVLLCYKTDVKGVYHCVVQGGAWFDIDIVKRQIVDKGEKQPEYVAQTNGSDLPAKKKKGGPKKKKSKNAV